MNRFAVVLAFSFILIFYYSTNAQHLTIDPSPGKKEESSIRLKLIKSGLVGINSIGHLTLTGYGLFYARYSGRKGTVVEFDLSTTYTPLFLNKNDQRNTASHLLNPLGGLINGGITFSHPLQVSENKVSKVRLRTGLKWVEAIPIKGAFGKNFLDQFAELGWVYQNLLAEDPLENKQLYFLAFPHVFAHYSDAKQRSSFFGNQLPPAALGYGIEVGLEFNRNLQLTLLGSQFLNAESAALKKGVLSLSVSYALLK